MREIEKLGHDNSFGLNDKMDALISIRQAASRVETFGLGAKCCAVGWAVSVSGAANSGQRACPLSIQITIDMSWFEPCRGGKAQTIVEHLKAARDSSWGVAPRDIE